MPWRRRTAAAWASASIQASGSLGSTGRLSARRSSAPARSERGGRAVRAEAARELAAGVGVERALGERSRVRADRRSSTASGGRRRSAVAPGCPAAGPGWSRIGEHAGSFLGCGSRSRAIGVARTVAWGRAGHDPQALSIPAALQSAAAGAARPVSAVARRALPAARVGEAPRLVGAVAWWRAWIWLAACAIRTSVARSCGCCGG